MQPVDGASQDTMPADLVRLFESYDWTPHDAFRRAGARYFRAVREPERRVFRAVPGYRLELILSESHQGERAAVVRLVNAANSMDGCVLGKSEPESDAFEVLLNEAVVRASKVLDTLTRCIGNREETPPCPL